MTDSRLLADLPTTAIAAITASDPVVVLPTGAIEAHGPHLPLSTDYLMAEAISTAAVTRAAEGGVNVWQLPGLAFTKSDEHHWAAGTVWLSNETMMATIVDIGRSLANSGVKRFAFLNGHGGNSALLQVACRELRRRFGLQTFLMHGLMPADQGGDSAADERGVGVHGGLSETSLILHLRPDLVHMEAAQRHVPEHLPGYRYVGFGKSVSFGWISDDFDASGVIGDPTGATAELGAKYFDAAVDHAAGALTEIAVFDPRGPSA